MKRKLNDFLPDASAPATVTAICGIRQAGDFKLVTAADIQLLFRRRELFSHKGTYGHALIIAGASQTMGAALLCAMGCLHAGAGLTTAAIPEAGLTALNTLLPEVMYVSKTDLEKTDAFKKYDAIAIGPGIGQAKETLGLLKTLYQQQIAVVADADALNLMAGNNNWQANVVANSILTPHMNEFDRLFGAHKSWWERLQTAVVKAKAMNCVIVLKNQFTFIADQEGLVYVNPTGNPAMAQGGMGDVLTGIITAYVAQGYSPKDAALLGCYFHGSAGDELAKVSFTTSAGKVAIQLPKTINEFLTQEIK